MIPDRSDSGPPQTIRVAYLLMLVAAAVEVVLVIMWIVQFAMSKNDDLGESAARAAAAKGVFRDVLGAAIWVLMARANRRGSKRARTIGTVLFAVNTLSVLVVLAGLASADLTDAPGGLVTLFILALSVVGVTWVLGLVTVVLLWLPESSAYFAASEYGGSVYRPPSLP